MVDTFLVAWFFAWVVFFLFKWQGAKAKAAEHWAEVVRMTAKANLNYDQRERFAKRAEELQANAEVTAAQFLAASNERDALKRAAEVWARERKELEARVAGEHRTAETFRAEVWVIAEVIDELRPLLGPKREAP